MRMTASGLLSDRVKLDASGALYARHATARVAVKGADSALRARPALDLLVAASRVPCSSDAPPDATAGSVDADPGERIQLRALVVASRRGGDSERCEGDGQHGTSVPVAARLTVIWTVIGS